MVRIPLIANMSQKKVDTYKSEKRNRAKNAKKEKIAKTVRVCALFALVIALFTWLIWSIIDKKTATEVATSLENLQVTDEDGNAYNVVMNDDGTAQLVVGDTSSDAESADNSETASGISNDVESEPDTQSNAEIAESVTDSTETAQSESEIVLTAEE